MAEIPVGGDNVSAQLPTTNLEAAALWPAIADLLNSIPKVWAELDSDRLTKLQERALFLMTAAGMVEHRGWIRTSIANHSTCFEFRFQATGEGGFAEAMGHAADIEYQSWGDAWRKWNEGEAKAGSPFHTQSLKPQEWRLTDQGSLALGKLNSANSGEDLATVLDFVLKRGLYGPGYWLRRPIAGEPLNADERRFIDKQLAAGRDLLELSRPMVYGSGKLLEIRKIEQPAASQSVNLTNWGEGASEFANAFAKLLGPAFEAAYKASHGTIQEDGADAVQSTTPSSPKSGESQPTMPTPFRGGEVVFSPNQVSLCGVDICSGPRSQTRRKVLELLSTRRSEGKFESFSGEQLAERVGLKGGDKAAAGVIRDLRDYLVEVLRDGANISCGRQDIILSGGTGYRFADCVTVQNGDKPEITQTTDIELESDVRNVLNGDVRNVPNGDVRNVRNVRNVPDDAANARREWILQQIEQGHKLRAPAVAKQFKCHLKTAQRDLTILRDEEKIEFVGATRTGYYRLRSPPETGQ